MAHRGASSVEAEHTLAAYRRALDDGADGLECDVRLTRDGVLVCVHDRTVNRTSTGRGVVSTLELAELSELDFGRWHREANGHGEEDPLLTANWEAPDYDRTSVLTLERLLEAVAEVDRPVRLAIETKHPTRYAGLVETTLVSLLQRFGLATADGNGKDRVQVMSFAPSGLRRVKQLAPELPTVHLMRRVALRHRDGSISPSASIAGPSVEGVTAFPSYVERAHRNGYEVHVWTVDEPDDVARMVELGVDVLITNQPAAVLAVLDELQGVAADRA
ncbi:MAG: glycerophosphodiester phosphodiesterase [Frankiaceae bacterium]|nr:glycerophosphodiester phosphodiesterase [Frankiaceae bacterium]MBV9871265.1 glycerophosphodiester phosphodiesterase [Frankiaceae bacterium]